MTGVGDRVRPAEFAVCCERNGYPLCGDTSCLLSLSYAPRCMLVCVSYDETRATGCTHVSSPQLIFPQHFHKSLSTQHIGRVNKDYIVSFPPSSSHSLSLSMVCTLVLSDLVCLPKVAERIISQYLPSAKQQSI